MIWLIFLRCLQFMFEEHICLKDLFLLEWWWKHIVLIILPSSFGGYLSIERTFEKRIEVFLQNDGIIWKIWNVIAIFNEKIRIFIFLLHINKYIHSTWNNITCNIRFNISFELWIKHKVSFQNIQITWNIYIRINIIYILNSKSLKPGIHTSTQNM